jgi:hypothetical protein
LSDIRPARSEQQVSESERRGVGVPHAGSQTTIWQCDADKAKSLKLKTWEAVDAYPSSSQLLPNTKAYADCQEGTKNTGGV